MTHIVFDGDIAALSAVFNKDVQSFETGVHLVSRPDIEDWNGYARIRGERRGDGWSLTKEFFYGYSMTPPDARKPEGSQDAGSGLSDQAAYLVLHKHYTQDCRGQGVSR